MAQANELDPDDFGSPDSAEEDATDDKVDPDPGEDAMGHITGANFAAGGEDSFGFIEIDGKRCWLNGSTAGDLVAGLLLGKPVRLVVDDEEQSFTPPGEDEEISYYEKELQFVEDG